jgi:predicted NBD/HSP70 family sugar kinase
VENDVNAAAIGELKFGAGRGHQSMIYLTISTGVAAGIIIDGKLLRGARHCAGEIGFMLGEPDHIGREWGINGCLELTAAGIGIAHQWESLKGVTDVSAIDVFRAAHAGDVEALRIVSRAGDYLSLASVSLCTVIDPEVLVLGGSIVRNEAMIFRRIESVVNTTLPFPPRVMLAELGGDSPLIGALALAQSHTAD